MVSNIKLGIKSFQCCILCCILWPLSLAQDALYRNYDLLVVKEQRLAREGYSDL